MEFWAIPYLIIYGLFFFAWMVRTNRQIMFWLYLWQLKEYHWGRFWDHFSTHKGRSIFINKFFLLKIVLLVAGAAFLFVSPAQKPLFDYSQQYRWMPVFFLGVTVTTFFVEALWTVVLFFKNRLLHPDLTKKSVMLIAATHIVFFSAALAIYFSFLGEMSLLDLCFAALTLVILDVLAPIIISFIVLGLQPLTIYEKNKILKRAAVVIDGRSDLLTIGIAGSYGKSAVKELLAQVLSQKYRVLKTKANQNTEIGVAQTIISELKPEHEIFVCEIGAVHKGRIKQVAGIVKPKIGILTGINQQHLAVFGSQQNIIDAKFEILTALPESGTAIVNWSSSMLMESFESQKARIMAARIIFCGKDIYATEIEPTVDSLFFNVNCGGEKLRAHTNAKGDFMAEPILLVVAGAVAAGMDIGFVVDIINKTDFTPFNIGVSKNSAGMNILSSTYSANPDGVAAHLDYLKLWPGKKAIVMPCLIELGRASKEVHFEIGKKIAQVCDLAVITTKDRFGEIKKGAIGAGMKGENIIYSENPVVIDDVIKNRLAAGDTLLLEGRSRDEIIDRIRKAAEE